MADTGNTTSPADPPRRTSAVPADTLALAVVVCQCLPEPHREGEVALLDPDARRPLLVGRAGDPFFQQRPGERIDCGRLRGDTLSGEQLLITPERDGARVHNIGRAPVLIEDTQVPQDTSVFVVPPTVIEVYDHSVLLLTRRPLSLPRPHRLLLPLQPFGETCSMGFDGESPLAWQQREQAVFAAGAGRHVLIYGETGTGKDLVARAVHAKSFRARGPFVKVNCAELTSELAALRLFGGRKNWPNPGTPETAGYFGEAEGGTLFLDEIGEIGEALQANLLRALEEAYNRVGETHARPTRCVVVGATNRGHLGVKEDVRMRFGVVLETSSLAERREDIAQMLRQLLLKRAEENTEFAAQYLETDVHGRAHVRVDASLVTGLLRRPPRGNVREMDIILGMSIEAARGERPLRWPSSKLGMLEPARLDIVDEPRHQSAAALLKGLDMRRPETLAPPAIAAEPVPRVGEPQDASKERVLQTLSRNQWHFGRAAAELGISVDRLYRLRIKFGLHQPR